MTITREEAKLLLIRPVVSSNVISETKAREIEAYNMAIEALSERTGEWILDPNGMDWNLPAWKCSECGFVANYIGVYANGLGSNPMHCAGSKFCPQCGVRITGYKNEIDDMKG